MYYLCSRFCEAYVQLLSVQIAFTPQAQGVAQVIFDISVLVRREKAFANTCISESLKCRKFQLSI